MSGSTSTKQARRAHRRIRSRSTPPQGLEEWRLPYRPRPTNCPRHALHSANHAGILYTEASWLVLNILNFSLIQNGGRREEILTSTNNIHPSRHLSYPCKPFKDASNTPLIGTTQAIISKNHSSLFTCYFLSESHPLLLHHPPPYHLMPHHPSPHTQARSRKVTPSLKSDQRNIIVSQLLTDSAPTLGEVSLATRLAERNLFVGILR